MNKISKEKEKISVLIQLAEQRRKLGGDFLEEDSSEVNAQANKSQ